jgi:hypothetical protein
VISSPPYVTSRSPVTARSPIVTEIAVLLNEMPLLPRGIALLRIEIAVGPVVGERNKKVSALVP